MTEPERRFEPASDGYPIHLTTWPASRRPIGRAVILHGVQSHAGWYEALGRSLAEAGWTVEFPDRRGSGRNTLDRGHAPSMGRLLADVAERLEAARREEPGRPVVLAGISWGGKLAVVTAARRPDLLDGLALICPGLLPRVGVPLKQSLGIFAAWATRRRRYFPIPLADPALFTDSAAGQRFIADDPLALREASSDLLAASRITDFAVRRSAKRVKAPTLLMLAGEDRIIDNAKTLDYFGRIATDDRSLVAYPGAHHTLEFEADPSIYARDLTAWMNDRAAATAPAR